METEIVQPSEYGDSNTEIVPAESSVLEPVVIRTSSTSESTEEALKSIQAQVTDFFTNVTSYTTEFFRNNRQLLTALGWITLAFFSARFLLAGLDAIDDIPFVTPILKLAGLVYVVRLVWRYLIREHDRQELMQTLDRARTEMFGGKS